MRRTRADIEEAQAARTEVAEYGDIIAIGPTWSGGLLEVGANDDDGIASCDAIMREILRKKLVVRTIEKMLDEVENANDRNGPDPVATVDDPDLATIAVA